MSRIPNPNVPIADTLAVGGNPIHLRDLISIVPDPTNGITPLVYGPSTELLHEATQTYLEALGLRMMAHCHHQTDPCPDNEEMYASTCANYAFAETTLLNLLLLNQTTRTLTVNIIRGEVVDDLQSPADEYTVERPEPLDDEVNQMLADLEEQTQMTPPANDLIDTRADTRTLN